MAECARKITKQNKKIYLKIQEPGRDFEVLHVVAVSRVMCSSFLAQRRRFLHSCVLRFGFHGTILLDMVWHPINRTYCGEVSGHSKLHLESESLSRLWPWGARRVVDGHLHSPGRESIEPHRLPHPLGKIWRRCSILKLIHSSQHSTGQRQPALGAVRY